MSGKLCGKTLNDVGLCSMAETMMNKGSMMAMMMSYRLLMMATLMEVWGPDICQQ